MPSACVVPDRRPAAKRLAQFSRLMLAVWLLAPLSGFPEDTHEAIEEVVVTGSYIKGSPVDSRYAVTAMDREQLAAQGTLSMVDLFKNLGANAGAMGEVTSWLNGTGQAVPESVANVNLRGLGASRTLVLFNGRRQTYVPARLVGGRFVDINVLPSIMIKRIEVLKEGAAAVYGSDAVAGVVNFMTRGDFEGFEASVSWEHFNDAGDGKLASIWGAETGFGHLVVAVEHTTREALNLSERPWTLPADGDAYWGWSGVGNPGAFIIPHPNPEEAVSGPLSNQIANRPRFVDPNCEPSGGENWGGTCGFRFGPWDNLIEEQRQRKVFAELSRDVGSRHGLHLEALWADAVIPDWLTTPSFPPVIRFDDMQLVSSEHPGRVAFVERYSRLPTDWAGEVDLSGDEDWYFFGRLVGNSGPGRAVQRDSETMRLAVAMEGGFEWADLPLSYDTAIAWSHSEGLYNRPAEYAYRRFLAFRGYGGTDCGVGVISDVGTPSGLALGPVPAGVSPGQGDCAYYNPFSSALEYSAQPESLFERQANPDYDPSLANDPALIEWISEEVQIKSESELLVIDGVVSGAIVNSLLDFALGYQFRRFEARAMPNAPGNLELNPCWIPGETNCPYQTGLFPNVKGALPYSASQETHALFLEFLAQPIERGDIQLALHYEEHEQAKSFDPKLGLRFDLGQSLTLRACVQTTFRTPSVDDIALDISTKLELLHSVGVFKAIETQGSRDLEPESALTYNFGLVYQDAGMDFTLDYWSYDFQNPIGVLPFGAIESLYADRATRASVQDLIYCPGNRNDGSCGAGAIERVRVHHVNGPDTRSKGVDLSLGGEWFLGIGHVTWGMELSHVLSYQVGAFRFRDIELVPSFNAAGYLNDPVDGSVPPLPEWKGRARASLELGNLGIHGFVNWVSSYRDRARHAGDAYADIDDFLTLDATLIWRMPRRGITLSLAAFNLLDEEPPLIASDHFFDGMTHNPKGRRVKLEIRYALARKIHQPALARM